MKEQLLATLDHARDYTLSVAAAMPEKDYHFKPAAPVWNFAELIHHIGYGITWWEATFIHQVETEWNPPPATTSRAATLAYLEASFAALKKTVDQQQARPELYYGLQATLDHITHHRGQATVYLRCKGITPPEYVF